VFISFVHQNLSFTNLLGMRFFDLILITFLPFSIFAKCGQAIVSFPLAESISRNSNIIVEFHGGISPEFKDFGVKEEIFLKSKHERIRLIKQAEFHGSGMLQLIFKPEALLRSNESYSLDALKAYESIDPLRFYKSTHLYKNWKTSNLIDLAPPQMITSFEFCETRLMFMGCGNHTIAKFSFNASDKSEIFIETEIQDLDSGEIKSILIRSDGHIINVGKSMCSGNFKFRFESRYSVRFKLYDLNGNTDQSWSSWMHCPNPYDS